MLLYCQFPDSAMKKDILPVLLIVQIIVVNLLSLFPEFVESFYIKGFYLNIARISRHLFGNLPFSIGDLMYFLVIFLLLQWIYRSRKQWRLDWKINTLKLLSFVSVFYFLFHFLWAMNYHRMPLSDKMNLETEYTDAQLLDFTNKLILKTNRLHLQITADSLKKVVVPLSQDEVFQLSLDGYQHLAKKHPDFTYETKSVKKSLISLPLTYMGFSGYLNPFTNEAQVNDMVPMYSFPATSCHEMAHQLGYASESEANFIGYLSAVHNTNNYMKYSGYTLALRYCLRNWERRDKIMATQLLSKVNPGIVANFKESISFWEQYESSIETFFKILYDNFLKFNKQDEGLDSYSKFVNLLVSYYEDKELD